MPQLEEDEWPADGEQTTSEEEHLKDGGPDKVKPAAKTPAPPDYPPKLPEDADPTLD
jgi:hypothetical protein